MGSDGRILSQGSLSNALAKDVKLSEEAADDSRAIEQADEVIDESTKGNPATKSDGKLVMSEEVSEGHVGWSACAYPRDLLTTFN